MSIVTALQIGLVIGVLVGVILVRIIFKPNPVGSLRIDRSDPDDNPYLFLELSKDVSSIVHKKYVTLKVNVKNFITPK